MPTSDRTMQRLIIQMAFATDLRGDNPQAASETAMSRALSQADLPAMARLGVPPAECLTRVTLGLPDPGAIDAARLEALLPTGPGEIVCVAGGQRVEDEQTGARMLVVTAAAEVFLPRQHGWQLRSS